MIHRLWLGATTPEMAWTTKTLRQLNPEVEVIEHRWPPDEAVKLAQATAHLVLPDSHNQARHVANIARLVLLRDFGGWWVDYDLIPLVPFAELPVNATAEHRTGLRCNCWMSFEADHPALHAALDHIALTASGDYLSQSNRISGEWMLSDIWGDDVERLRMTIDSDGMINPEALHWGVHVCSLLRGQV